jgi:hypothetical protein
MKTPVNILAEIAQIVGAESNDCQLGKKLRQYVQSLPEDLTSGVGGK